MVCAVAGCFNPVRHKNLCNAHYLRLLRKGTTDLSRTANGLPLKFLKEALQHKDKKKCLIWPYAKNKKGYGQIHRKGRPRLAHRIVCRAVNGKPPLNKPNACHSCGNGYGGCINPHHTYWGSDRENELDKKIHGTDNVGSRHGMAKLTEQQVIKILKLINQHTDKQLAKKFSVSNRTINSIRLGKSWKHIPR